MRTTAIRGTAAAVLLSAAVLGLAGCVNAEKSAPAGAGDSVSYGNPPSTQPAATTTQTPPSGASSSTNPSGASNAGDQHNDADTTFLNKAVLLRQQVLTIAGYAQTSSTNSQIKALATKITQDKTPDVNEMTGWLSQWHQPAPSGQVTGVLSASGLSQLHSATGTAFDMHFSQAVKDNLTAAKQAATTEGSQGSNPQVKQTAQQWVGELTTELSQLNSATS